ncbi:NAD(P)H-hydrate dehydratase [Thalassotalea sp. HSM 43]|nr:NAD(P)H-hydrate dehydratase [Thalassotalea sp. HSM 43]
MLPVKLASSIPQYAYRAETIRQQEAIVAREQGVSMWSLMQTAGVSGFHLLQQLWPKANTILVVCGSGNNAGDGFVLATAALKQGLRVYLHSLQAIENYHDDAALACQQFLKAGGSICKINDVDFQRVDVVVDALLGTGIKGQVRQNYRDLMGLINKLAQPVLSLDLPSGLNGETGQPQGDCVQADATVTFIAVKQGLLTGRGIEFCGDIYLADLGLAKAFNAMVAADAQLLAPPYVPELESRAWSAHKGNSGTVLVAGGNQGFSGAVRLAAEAALRSGAGLVAVDCHSTMQNVVSSQRPEFVMADATASDCHNQRLLNKVDSICLGPGLGLDQFAKARLPLMAMDKVLVVDADALTLLAHQPMTRKNWVLTPHPKEAATLLGCSVAKVQQDRFAAVKAIANKYQAICVLKGAGTLISDGQQVFINMSGNPGMAVAGMGDVLAGIIAALGLQSQSLFKAVLTAVYIHGRAADIAALDGRKGMLPSDLFVYIRQLVNQH